MKRILHFAADGDTSGFFPQLARWHDRRRFRMSFATLRPMAPWLRDDMAAKGVATFSCEARGRSSYPLALLRLALHLRRAEIDVLHTHLFEPSVVGLLAGFLARTRVRVMTRHHSDYHTRIHKQQHVRLDRMCTGLGHAVIAVSRHTAKHLIEAERAPATKVHTILNGIDFDRVHLSAPEAPARLRAELGANDKHLVLMVGRFHPEKGYEHLLAALPRVKARVPKPLLVLIAGDGPFRARYEAEARKLGCAGEVQFLGYRTDVMDLMAAADLLVLPSVAEAFGLVAAEALYLGTPVVASRVGGIPEIVDDGIDGLLVPPGDSQSLAEGIVRLLVDAETRSRVAGAGKQKIAMRFRFEDMVRRYEALYEQLSDGRSRGAENEGAAT